MNSVPQLFIKSVVRLVPDLVDLPGAWRKVGQAYMKKCGSLLLTYAPSILGDSEAPWCFRYRLCGFDHIKMRTLSKDVVTEMAKSITSFKCDISYSTVCRASLGHWSSISSDDEKTLQLLAALDAPKKDLFLSLNTVSRWYTEVGSRYFHFWKSFTSLQLLSHERQGVPFFLQFLKSVVSVGRLRSIKIATMSLQDLRFSPDISDVPSNSFWADWFFSEASAELTSGLPSFGAAVEIIGRWKKMDPWKLAPNKIFYSTCDSSDPDERLKSFFSDMTPMSVDSADPRILEKIERKIPERISNQDYYPAQMVIQSLHYVDHPNDSSFRIYVAFLIDSMIAGTRSITYSDNYVVLVD
uniref:Nonstructural protein n=1 Tax=Steinernema glaseri TaxID=37863 RepID=A0A1I7YJZ7_9BILA